MGKIFMKTLNSSKPMLVLFSRWQSTVLTCEDYLRESYKDFDMPLIVLYDPEEGMERIDDGNTAYAIPSEDPMFVDAHIHYWARRAGNPFEDLDVLWIPRNARSGGDPIFPSILESVSRNIDHMYIWQEENIMGIVGHVDFTNWDRRDEPEVISCLNSFTAQNVFLALEMTEQTPFGSSAMQRWFRIWECVKSGIPTIYALPGAGTYQSAGCMACHKWHGKGQLDGIGRWTLGISLSDVLAHTQELQTSTPLLRGKRWQSESS